MATTSCPKVYEQELEKNFNNFEDILKTFPLFRGKGSHDAEEDADQVVGYLKVRVRGWSGGGVRESGMIRWWPKERNEISKVKEERREGAKETFVVEELLSFPTCFVHFKMYPLFCICIHFDMLASDKTKQYESKTL